MLVPRGRENPGWCILKYKDSTVHNSAYVQEPGQIRVQYSTIGYKNVLRAKSREENPAWRLFPRLNDMRYIYLTLTRHLVFTG
jgi:hypothetical protein